MNEYNLFEYHLIKYLKKIELINGKFRKNL